VNLLNSKELTSHCENFAKFFCGVSDLRGSLRDSLIEEVGARKPGKSMCHVVVSLNDSFWDQKSNTFSDVDSLSNVLCAAVGSSPPGSRSNGVHMQQQPGGAQPTYASIRDSSDRPLPQHAQTCGAPLPAPPPMFQPPSHAGTSKTLNLAITCCLNANSVRV